MPVECVGRGEAGYKQRGGLGVYSEGFDVEHVLGSLYGDEGAEEMAGY